MALPPNSKNAPFSKSSSNSTSCESDAVHTAPAPKRITFITLFPELLRSICESSILSRAQSGGSLVLEYLQLRDFSDNKHRTVDSTPYGGGEGMVIRVDVLHRAWEHAVVMHARHSRRKPRTIYLSPQGAVLTQTKARALAETSDEPLILVCGHYEGIDERFVALCVDEEISIGDYVLTGGELPAAVLVDSLVRWLPGVLGNDDSAVNDSLSSGADWTARPGAVALKYPQFTRPATFGEAAVPEILMSGNHAKIAAWRASASAEATRRKRPDLLPNPAANPAPETPRKKAP